MTTTLQDTLRANMLTALKDHTELELTTLRYVLSTIQTVEHAGKNVIVLDDAAVLKLLNQEVKTRRDTAATFIKGGAPDRAVRENEEADYLATYLPTRLTEDEVEAIVVTVVGENPEDNFGLIMKKVTAIVNGRADGKTISEFVRARL